MNSVGVTTFDRYTVTRRTLTSAQKHLRAKSVAVTNASGRVFASKKRTSNVCEGRNKVFSNLI